MSFYAETFRKLQPGYDPRQIEAFIRVEHPTLDHLSHQDLQREASIAAQCIEMDPVGAERLAQSFGL